VKREFLQLANKYEELKVGIGSWFVSQKLDGVRAFWDGGISRGIPASEVPWANTEKHGRYINPPPSTGLWTRYGQPIAAPGWWLDQLPDIPLDGELWAGVQSFQSAISTVRKLVPDDGDWDGIEYHVFDSPQFETIFADGDINNTHFRKRFRSIDKWIAERISRLDRIWQAQKTRNFEDTYHWLEKFLKREDGNLFLLNQEQLPYGTSAAQVRLAELLDSVTDQGGEGLMLRNPSSIWRPERVHSLLKVKPYSDAEGDVTGYVSGRETDKGSKLLGMMGALILRYQGQRLELSGFTDEERQMGWAPAVEIRTDKTAVEWATMNPGKEFPEFYQNPKFPRGSRVTFRFRELSDRGIPKEARYLRKA
jgi:DNA ligase-1